jgi:hypothetical protein
MPGDRGFSRWPGRSGAGPARYALLYDSPVPGYDAPAEQTSEPGIRVIRAIGTHTGRPNEILAGNLV